MTPCEGLCSAQGTGLCLVTVVKLSLWVQNKMLRCYFRPVNLDILPQHAEIIPDRTKSAALNQRRFIKPCLCSPKAELLSRAEGMVKDTSEYRCLQSQFSVLYNESLILKAQLDETRARLNTTRTARLRQLEHMEVAVCLRLVSA